MATCGLASESGLVRFDGVRFVTLTTTNVPALGNNHILSLLVDTNGVLWVGTAAGTLAARVGDHFSAVTLDPRLRDAPITRLASGPDGALWLAPAGHGLVRWHQGACDFVDADEWTPCRQWNSLLRQRAGGANVGADQRSVYGRGRAAPGSASALSLIPGRPYMPWLRTGRPTACGWR